MARLYSHSRFLIVALLFAQPFLFVPLATEAVRQTDTGREWAKTNQYEHNSSNWADSGSNLSVFYSVGSNIAVIGSTIYLFSGLDTGFDFDPSIFSASVSNPTSWADTGADLPQVVHNSSVAIIDNFVYLFGGDSDNNVYRAAVTSPTSWSDTGANLPGVLADSSVAVIGDHVYLFGGHNGSSFTNVIYRAPVANPTSWSDTSATLPASFSESAVAVIGSSVYLFGGRTGASTVTTNIYSAPITDPTSWSDTGFDLPAGRSAGSLAIIGDYAYLFGGNTGTAGSNSIYRAPLSNPTSWSNTGNTLAIAMSDAPLAIVNNYVYLFGDESADDSIQRALLTSDPSWFNSDYQYCRELTTTAGGNVGGVATSTTIGFALVATSTISTLAATSSGGHIYKTTTNQHGTSTPVDVLFTNGTDCNSAGGAAILDHYFEKYVAASGEFVLWVEPDSVSSTTPKSLLMYYGFENNSATFASSSEKSTFGALGETAIWNLSEDPSSAGTGGIRDSLGANHGTDNGTMITADQVQGQVDGSLDFDGTDDYVEIGGSTQFFVTGTPWTFSGWINLDSFTGNTYPYVLTARTNTTNAYEIVIGNDAGGYRGVLMGSGDASWVDSQTDVDYTSNLDRWVYLVARYNGGTATTRSNFSAYLDTVAQTLIGPGTFDTIAQQTWIGTSGDPDEDWNGMLDDLRLYNRELHWTDFRTIYNNTLDSTTFWDFGAEETEASGGRVIRLRGGLRLLGGVRFIPL